MIIKYGDAYGDAAALVREHVQARGGTIVIVFDGHQGDGWSAELAPDLFDHVPEILRRVADEIEASRGGGAGGDGHGSGGGVPT